MHVQHILPELQRPLQSDDTGAAVLKADALKFLTLFRARISKAQCVQLLPAVVAALGSPANVVHSYAATCLERLLTSKVGRLPECLSCFCVPCSLGVSESATPPVHQARVGTGEASLRVRNPPPLHACCLQEGGAPRFSLADVSPVLNDLLQKLFGAFSLPDSRENEYVMRCVTRVVVFVGPEVCTPCRRLSARSRCLRSLSAAHMGGAWCTSGLQPDRAAQQA